MPGGNTTFYAYPQDPINMFALDGMGTCWSFIDWACSAGKWTWSHRGTVVTVVATGVCVVPAVGWAACAAGQGFAYSVRVQQRGVKSRRVNAADAIFTVSSFGLGQVLKIVGLGIKADGVNAVLAHLVMASGRVASGGWLLRRQAWR